MKKKHPVNGYKSSSQSHTYSGENQKSKFIVHISGLHTRTPCLTKLLSGFVIGDPCICTATQWESIAVENAVRGWIQMASQRNSELKPHPRIGHHLGPDKGFFTLKMYCIPQGGLQDNLAGWIYQNIRFGKIDLLVRRLREPGMWERALLLPTVKVHFWFSPICCLHLDVWHLPKKDERMDDGGGDSLAWSAVRVQW